MRTPRMTTAFPAGGAAVVLPRARVRFGAGPTAVPRRFDGAARAPCPPAFVIGDDGCNSVAIRPGMPFLARGYPRLPQGPEGDRVAQRGDGGDVMFVAGARDASHQVGGARREVKLVGGDPARAAGCRAGRHVWPELHAAAGEQ